MVRICQWFPFGPGEALVVWCLPASVEKWQLETWDRFLLHDASWCFMMLHDTSHCPGDHGTIEKNDIPCTHHTTHATHAAKEVASQPLTRWVNPGQPNTPLTHAPTFEARLWWLLRQRNVQAKHHSNKFTRSQNVTDWWQSRMKLSENWNFEPKYDGGRARWLPNSSKL